ncbi:MAG: helix-turn-helix transcriptional regulator [Clostridia bacterium]|jgi:transcriptional regulator with XRE-family HTH domain|nr:helix-turn-helix transcriptional regulator [Clostridia bacterium]
MLKKERLKKGYTQEELSGLTNVDPRTILRIEKNLTVPKIDTYARMVIALELTNEEIGEHIRKIALKSIKEKNS